ncbi:uncharacterized protein F5891DRAFT_1188310 [Suillus fuscotomentosus]|uniref:Uncharacterized protein n=1 Tax=Suillus fuscotomentosus TaxID=1912939 RepID=A0AAD4E6Z1_9AGAM|nr:uncharacterized protein F5891DRAFT_1188310 [Suillus fuscotomentosus]KAG1900819.1 hypothetical protein F5891DRAFT_1188310 [Suillus fuscotomentosus]
MPTSAYERTSRPRHFKIGMVEDQEVGIWNSRLTVPSFWRSLSTPIIDAERHLNNHSCAVALALEGCELPVRAQAVLAIMELVVARDSVRDTVSLQVGKVMQGAAHLLKLSNETDLDILNQGMEAMVDQFQNELVPVAS